MNYELELVVAGLIGVLSIPMLILTALYARRPPPAGRVADRVAHHVDHVPVKYELELVVAGLIGALSVPMFILTALFVGRAFGGAT